MRRNRSKKEYRSMPNDTIDDQREDNSNFVSRQPQTSLTTEVPWAAILLAISLTLIGGFLLFMFTISCLNNENKAERVSISVFLIGWIALIPGVYHLVIAYYAYHKVPGYSYADIPNFD